MPRVRDPLQKKACPGSRSTEAIVEGVPGVGPMPSKKIVDTAVVIADGRGSKLRWASE